MSLSNTAKKVVEKYKKHRAKKFKTSHPTLNEEAQIPLPKVTVTGPPPLKHPSKIFREMMKSTKVVLPPLPESAPVPSLPARHCRYKLQYRPTKPGQLQHHREKGPPVSPARQPRYHLKEKLNILINKINTSAKDIHDEIQFIKQVPSHPRNRLKRKVKAIENNINIIKEIKNYSS